MTLNDLERPKRTLV